MGKRTCAIENCEKPPRARNWCRMHYARWRKSGNPLDQGKLIMGDDHLRFWLRVNRNGPVSTLRPELGQCWIWTADTYPEGYGRFWAKGRNHGAHRWNYEQEHGSVGVDLHLDHLCRIRLCVNPGHLEPVPPRVNILRGTGAHAQNARKTHCIRGHAFTNENTRIDRRGRRNCKTCQRAHCLAFYHRNKTLAL